MLKWPNQVFLFKNSQKSQNTLPNFLYMCKNKNIELGEISALQNGF
jgi:hypothetical protein